LPAPAAQGRRIHEDQIMRFDFSKVDDTRSFVSVPEGSYVCRIAEVRQRASRDGSPRWSYRLEVVEGEYSGRTAAWDSITWSDRGIVRVKLVLGALGFDTSGMLELDPNDLIDRKTRVSFLHEKQENAETGERVERLRVPYAGYEPVYVGNGADSVAKGADEFGP
jgi:hypothetical protein